MSGGGGGFWNDLGKGALAVATGGLSLIGEKVLDEAQKPMREAQDQRRKEEERMNALMTESRNRQAEQESVASATKANLEARKRQRQLAASSQGRRDTILTSPLASVGAAAPPPAAGKTLLGQ